MYEKKKSQNIEHSIWKSCKGIRHFSMSETSEFFKYKIISTKSDVLTGKNVKMEVFRNAAPCIVVDNYGRFEGTA
jgi:hypothetical protein